MKGKVCTYYKRPVRFCHIAQCQICEWSCRDFGRNNIVKEAKKHTYKTGHTVIVEKMHTQIYYLGKENLW